MVLRPKLFRTHILFVLIIFASVGIAPLHAAAQAIDGDILQMRGLRIDRIEIHNRDYANVVLERNAGEWDVLEPVRDRANQAVVNDLLNRLARMTVADVLAGEDELFGFDPPQTTVKLTSEDGQVRELWIGNLRSPVSLFVKRAGGENVYAVSNVTLSRLGEYPMGFVDSTLLRLDSPDQVNRIRVRVSPDNGEDPEEFEVVRNQEGWEFDHGAVAFDIDGFFRAARLLQATGRLPDDASETGRFYPAPGTAQIVIGQADGSEIVLEIGRKSADGHHYYVKVSGREEVYLVPGFHAEHLVTRSLAISDSLLAFDPDFVNQMRVKLSPSASEIVYERNRDDVWESNRSVVFGFDFLLDAVAAVGADRLVSSNQEDPAFGFGTSPEAATIQMRFRDNNTLLLELGSKTPDGTGVYLKTSMRPGVYVGDVAHLANIVEATQTVRSRLFPASLADVSTIRIQQGETDFVVQREGTAWRRAGAEVPEARVKALIDALAGLAADSLPPIPDDESSLGFYPHSTGMRVTVTFNDGVERYLDLGAGVQVGTGWFASTSYYATVSDLDVVAFIREQAANAIKNAANALK